MNDELKTKVINWLKTFPKHLKTIMKKFRKGESQFHLIRLVSHKDTIQLWMSEYPKYCLDFLKKEVAEDEYMYELKNYFGLDDDDLEDYKNDIEILISDGFLEHMIVDEGYGEELPSDLFDVMKDKIFVGDIVYAPFYETRMYYGIHLACLDKNNNIKLREDEGHYPGVEQWQKRIMDYNKLSFEETINHIENTYGDWEQGYLIEMWK